MAGCWGRVLVDGKDRGAAFALGRRLVITANHVIRDQKEKPVVYVPAGGEAVIVEGVQLDAAHDAAVLRLMKDVEFLPTSSVMRGAGWRVESPPPGGNDPQLHGTVTAVRMTIRNAQDRPIEVMQLQVDEQLGDFGGYSGSAVLDASGRAVVALLVEQKPLRTPVALGERRVASNVLYGVPIGDVVTANGLSTVRASMPPMPEAMDREQVAGHVFISYVREDSDQVDRLQEVLQSAGIPVWRDTADLWPGEDWRLKIRHAITGNALVFIACFSNASLARGKSYQNEELTLAIDQLRLRSPDEPWLIPVRLDECEIPDRDIGGGRTLASIQRVDLFGDEFDTGSARLIQAVMRILGRYYQANPDKYVSVRRPAPVTLEINPIVKQRSGSGNALENTEGAVILMVHHTENRDRYRFQFVDVDNPPEVIDHPVVDPTQHIQRLAVEMRNLATGRVPYSGTETRNYLMNLGAQLWIELIPEEIRSQFWERQSRIRQLTILSNVDSIPWEILYPMDSGHDAGFLVEQFPLAHTVSGSYPVRQLHLQPAHFVLPPGAPPGAEEEVGILQRLLGPSHGPKVVTTLTPLLELIRTGDIGLLHFACHNRYDAIDGVSLMIDSKPFTPSLLVTARLTRSLAASAPLVFVNASSSVGWARPFLAAGAGAFVGALWDVTSAAALNFTKEFYSQLVSGASLGDAVTSARRAIQSHEGDPSWTAYTVYGDPNARLNI